MRELLCVLHCYNVMIISNTPYGRGPKFVDA